MAKQETAGGAGVGPSLEEESRRRAQRPSADTIDVYEALDAAALADLAGDVVAQGREEERLRLLAPLYNLLRNHSAR